MIPSRHGPTALSFPVNVLLGGLKARDGEALYP
jgi:hypothetical protein